MTGSELKEAQEFFDQYAPLVPKEELPLFHVNGGIGWINDPNGFSVYKGEYHLFYQYHPYSIQWGPMHWGHVKTKDFITWERMPIALAPDSEADYSGCFSGGAVELPDGRHLLMYTGVQNGTDESGMRTEIQQQCIAVGDGTTYKKYEGNPVLTAADLPEGGSSRDFRDPKVWYEDGRYYSVIGNRTPDSSGAILLYESEDGFHWNYVTTLDACCNEYGKMWECPDFFPLDGKQLLITSPQEMLPVSLEFHAGYGVICLTGDYDKETHTYTREGVQAVDYGTDFYAPQTLLTPDGRRVMIAWMQNWTTSRCWKDGVKHFGEMTLPRELELRDGKLIQNPVRELEKYRGRRVSHRHVFVREEMNLSGVRGRVLDMTVNIRPAGSGGYRYFRIRIAKDGEFETCIRYKTENSIVKVDRSRGGFPFDIVHSREFLVRDQGGVLKLRLVMDRNSLELFANDGEQAASFVLYTRASAEAISFESDGGAIIDVEKYELVF